MVVGELKLIESALVRGRRRPCLAWTAVGGWHLRTSVRCCRLLISDIGCGYIVNAVRYDGPALRIVVFVMPNKCEGEPCQPCSTTRRSTRRGR